MAHFKVRIKIQQHSSSKDQVIIIPIVTSTLQDHYAPDCWWGGFFIWGGYVCIIIGVVNGEMGVASKKWAWLTKIFAGANAPVHLSLHSYLRGWQLWHSQYLNVFCQCATRIVAWNVTNIANALHSVCSWAVMCRILQSDWCLQIPKQEQAGCAWFPRPSLSPGA